MAADNNNINEETIDGKNMTHATTLWSISASNVVHIPPHQVQENCS